jgi:hypothetical protein
MKIYDLWPAACSRQWEFEAGCHTVVNRVQIFQLANFEKRTQDLEPAFHDAAQFYWGRSTAWL